MYKLCLGFTYCGSYHTRDDEVSFIGKDLRALGAQAKSFIKKSDESCTDYSCRIDFVLNYIEKNYQKFDLDTNVDINSMQNHTIDDYIEQVLRGAAVLLPLN